MIKKIKVCDKCNAELKDVDKAYRISVYLASKSKGHYDYCQRCTKETFGTIKENTRKRVEKLNRATLQKSL